MPESPKRKVDGRTLRSDRSKQAVAQAGFDLLNEGHVRPTAADIAKRAGVSLRLVFHHFKDMEGLYARIHELHWQDLQPLIVLDVDNNAPFEDRVRAFVKKRFALYQVATPVRRATLVLAVDNGLVATALDQFRAILRAQVSWFFEPELAALGDERATREAGLLASTCWSAHEALTVQQGLSLERAKDTFEASIRVWLRP